MLKFPTDAAAAIYSPMSHTYTHTHIHTYTQEVDGVLINVTMPSECMPVDQRCLDEHLSPLIDVAHNTTASADEKNAELHSFCASECGQK